MLCHTFAFRPSAVFCASIQTLCHPLIATKCTCLLNAKFTGLHSTYTLSRSSTPVSPLNSIHSLVSTDYRCWQMRLRTIGSRLTVIRPLRFFDLRLCRMTIFNFGPLLRRSTCSVQPAPDSRNRLCGNNRCGKRQYWKQGASRDLSSTNPFELLLLRWSVGALAEYVIVHQD